MTSAHIFRVTCGTEFGRTAISQAVLANLEDRLFSLLQIYESTWTETKLQKIFAALADGTSEKDVRKALKTLVHEGYVTELLEHSCEQKDESVYVVVVNKDDGSAPLNQTL